MATRKRPSPSAPHIDTVSSNPSKPKKLKNNDLKDQISEEQDFMDTTKPSTSFSSMLSMEKRKNRKAFDKERRKTNKNNDDNDPLSNPKHKELQQKDSNLGSRLKHNEVSVVGSSSRNGSEVAKFHIDVFNELASADALKREVAVEKMMEELIEVQKNFESNGSGKDDCGLKLEAQKDDGLNGCAQSVRYAVRRLIRGVSSSRECARQGFALGLTMVVGTIPAIKLDALLKLIVELLEVSSSMKGQEVRECLLGRLFAYGALARSGRLAEEWNFDHSTPIIKEFTSSVISLAAKKTYLREPGVAVILDLVEKLPIEAVLTYVLEAPGLQEWFKEAIDVGNPDALLLALKIQEKIHVDSTMFGNLLPHPFSTAKLFSSDHLTSLTECFKNSSFCQPRVHSVWPVLVNVLLPEVISQAEDITSASNSLKKHKKNRKSNSSEEVTLKNLQCFCEAIERSLLLSSHDRKHLAFDIMLLILPKLPASFLPILLSYKLVQCLLDVLSTKDSWLHKVSQNFLKELSTWVGNDDVRRVSVIVALQKHSNGKFDSVTRTKTVKDLMAGFETESGCMLFIQNLINMFVDEGSASEEPSDQSQTTDDNSEIGSNEEKDLVNTNGNYDSLKIWIVESLPSILKNLKLDPEAKFRVQKEILKFLTVQGLFSASLGSEITSFELEEKFKWPKTAASSTICGICIEQIQSLLVGAQKLEGSRTLSKGSESSDLGYFFMRFFTTLRNIPSVSLFRTLSNEDEKAFEKLQELEAKLSREERGSGVSADLNKLHAMRYLLMQLLLQVLQRPGEFSDAVSELIICCKKAFAASIQMDYSEDDSDGDDDPELMDVLVDTLLSLLPQSSVPMRSAIEQVFKYFCENVTDDGLLRMLRVIKKDLKPPRHRGSDSEDNDDDDEDFLGIEEDEADEAETGETAESEEQTDDSEAVAEVEQGSKESDDSDDSDGGMDDDSMFRMDSYLAQIFKEKKNQAGSETAQSQLVLFKLRVLSLLEIYLHENPGKPQVLTVCSNLTQALVNPQTTESSEQLAQRIWGILQKKVFKAKEFPKGETIELSSLQSLLEKNLKLASKPFKKKKSAGHPSKKKQSASWKRYKMIVSLARDSTYWVLKIIDAKNFSETELQRVCEVFKGLLEGYFESKKSQIKADFLKEIFRRRPWIGQHLFGFLVEKCSSSKSEFRQVESLELVMEIFKSMVPSNPNESNRSSLKEMLKNHMQKIGHLINVLVTNMPEKQSRRADVRKFCNKIFHTVTNDDLRKSLLESLSPEAQSACEFHFGELFLNLKRSTDNGES